MLPSYHKFTAILIGLAGSGTAQSQVLFTSSLDSTTGWTTVQEAVPSSLATFGYDYSTIGIPASPNGGGSTRGLRLAANSNTTVQVITAATTATFSGNYRVTFDFWGNSVGPFPVGGTGATEYLGGGVGFSGISPRAGASLLMTIEAGSSIDYRLDKAAAPQTVSAGGPYNPAIASRDNSDPYFSSAFIGQSPPSAQTTLFPATQTGTIANGGIGFKWYSMQIDVDSILGTATFSVLNPASSVLTNIGTLNQTGTAVPVTGSGSLTLLDSFATSVSNASLTDDLVFAVFDNYRVVQIPEPSSIGLLGLAGLLAKRRRR